MASAVSNRYYARVLKVTNLALLLVGLVLVVMSVVNITTTKLDRLRTQIAQQEASFISAAERTKQLECLARNVYWEAGNQSFEGKVAVAQVTLNRVEDGRFGDGICGVVYQKNKFYEKVICQFSWVCEGNGKVTKPIHGKLYDESYEVAKKVLLEDFRLASIKDAIYYHATYVNPGWRKQKITQIGQHIFYKG